MPLAPHNRQLVCPPSGRPATPVSENEIPSKLFTECHSCRKCEVLHGITLSKCAGCGVALYCGKQCQRAAWPQHRDDCKTYQAFRSGIAPHQNTALDTLLSFTSKLSAPLAKYGLQAFDLERHPTRGLRDILFIGLRPRPGARLVRLSYTVEFIRICPITSMPSQAVQEQLRELVKRGIEENRERQLPDFDGVVMVLTDVRTGVCMTKSVAFQRREELSSPSWKEDLIYHINNGIVL